MRSKVGRRTELRRRSADPGVVTLFEGRRSQTLYLSVLTLVTRNLRDFQFPGLEVVDPWSTVKVEMEGSPGVEHFDPAAAAEQARDHAER